MISEAIELVFAAGDRIGESIPIDDAEVTIGRSRSNWLILNDPMISREHLRLTVEDEAVMAHDLGSSHGTYLNDKRLRGSVSLNPGDIIQLGEIKLRFVRADTSDGEKTEFAAFNGTSGGSAEGAETQFADISEAGLSETNFMPAQQSDPDDSFDRTRVVEDDETRIMDAAEFRGLKAGATVGPNPRKRIVLAAVLVVLALVSVCALLGNSEVAGSSQGQEYITYRDDEYDFSIRYPAEWHRIDEQADAVIAFGLKNGVKLSIYADKNTSYGTTGLQAGFRDYSDNVLPVRMPGVSLSGSKLKRIGALTTVFYGTVAGPIRGKGIYVLSGDSEFCVECTAPKASYKAYTKLFGSVLMKFRLGEKQIFIDYPLAQNALRRVALANPAAVRRNSRHEFDVGVELMKNCTVKPDNLFKAVQTLKNSLTTASALGTRPEFNNDAAELLLKAEHQLKQSLSEQKFHIVLAERQYDFEGAYWESVRLMQMMPDKTTAWYQFAAKRVKKYSGIKNN